jgi:predicted nuclease of predicted toxin-antitoxin system
VLKLLLDANLSRETAAFLSETFGYDAVDLVSLGLHHLDDDEVLEMAKRERRILITFDLDFGAIYHQEELGSFGAILLRLKDQSIESVNLALTEFFTEHPTLMESEPLLVIIDQSKLRIIRKL